jgi:hypothetical protein
MEKKAHATSTANTAKMQGRCSVLQSVFCHGFCKPTHMQHIYFLKDREKNKRAASHHTQQKPTPKRLPEAK